MARSKNTLNPERYGLTQQDVDRVIRLHDMCEDMDDAAFNDLCTAAWAIKLVRSCEKIGSNRPAV